MRMREEMLPVVPLESAVRELMLPLRSPVRYTSAASV